MTDQFLLAKFSESADLREHAINVTTDVLDELDLPEANLVANSIGRLVGSAVCAGTYGDNSSQLTSTLPDDAYRGANHVSANLIWLPGDRMGLGLEYLHGIRENKDGEQGNASRLQTAFR